MARIIRRLRKLGVSLLGLAAVALIALIQIADPAPLERLRMQIFDTYQSLAPRKISVERPVVLVDIDEDSIDQLGQWPWPRSDLAQLVDRLAQAGAKAVVFDIVFSESDRTSPDAVAAHLAQSGQEPELSRRLAQLPGNDAQLARSFERVPVVTGYFLDRERRGRDVEPKVGFTLHGSMPTSKVASYQGSLQPLPVLATASAGSGFVSLESDADGIVRRVPLVAIHRDVLIPSLSLEAARLALGKSSLDLLASDGSGETLASPGAAVMVRLDGVEIPVNDAGEMWLHFPRPGSESLLPAAPIITGEMKAGELARQVGGKIVFVGGSAAGLQDLVSTPVSERIAGVTTHASAVEQILSGHFLERPDWAFGLELFLALALGIGFALLLPRLGAVWGALAAFGGIVTSFAASWLGFTHLRFLLDPTYPVLVLAVVYTIQTVAVYYREERQRSYIHSAFDRYLSPELVRQIADDPGKLELGGEERDMSVLMCDIRGFSSISEHYSPRDLIAFLIEFLTPMSDILLAHRATIDKYIGDAILAFWNAPLDDPDHHRHAVQAALAMRDALAELNRTGTSASGTVWPGNVQIGIGLNSGVCCVGNMGSRQRLSYSLIGDTVNVASRFEGLTKQYGVKIIVGEKLARANPGFALVELDRVRVVGRDTAEDIFMLLGDEGHANNADFLALAKAHSAMLQSYFRMDWAGALATIAQHRELYVRADMPKLANVFEARIAHLKSDPPAPGWDGVFEATMK